MPSASKESRWSLSSDRKDSRACPCPPTHTHSHRQWISNEDIFMGLHNRSIIHKESPMRGWCGAGEWERETERWNEREWVRACFRCEPTNRWMNCRMAGYCQLSSVCVCFVCDIWGLRNLKRVQPWWGQSGHNNWWRRRHWLAIPDWRLEIILNKSPPGDAEKGQWMRTA